MSTPIEQKNIPAPVALPRRGSHPYLLALAGLVLGGGSALLGYSVGHQQGVTAVGASADQVDDLRKQLRTQTTAAETLTQTLGSTTQERDLAVENNHQLSSQVNGLIDGRALAVARQDSLIDWAAQNGGMPLDVRDIQIKPLPEQAYEYRVDVRAIASGQRSSSGTLALYLIQGETLLEIPVNPARFNVRGFEQLVGRWTMPKGITPQFIEVRLQSGGQSVVKRFAWEQGDVIHDMPATLADVPPIVAIDTTAVASGALRSLTSTDTASTRNGNAPRGSEGTGTPQPKTSKDPASAQSGSSTKSSKTSDSKAAQASHAQAKPKASPSEGSKAKHDKAESSKAKSDKAESSPKKPPQTREQTEAKPKSAPDQREDAAAGAQL